jgi:predicted DNA repair protein MutK
MAGSSFFALLDDISALLDDVAVFTKAATKKTAGVLSDDLALNAEQLTGLNPDRELPIVWKVFKGSLLNKCILVPVALLLSEFAPLLITILLVAGGAFLCYEGVEKLIEVMKKRKKSGHHSSGSNIDEKQKIKGAIRTDFILSAEIIVIALETIANEPLFTRSLTLSVVALLLTVLIYGSVSVIVKIDDLGLYLIRKHSQFLQKLGSFFINLAPRIMKFLSLAGMVAMFLVGGGIIVHEIEPIHHLSASIISSESAYRAIFETLFTLVCGILVGAVIVLISKVKASNPQ